MRIVHRSRHGDRVVDIEIDDPGAPLAELLFALGEVDDRVVVDGREVAAAAALSDLGVCEGSVLEVAPSRVRSTPTARALVVVGGVRAGVAHPLPLGAIVAIGRSAQADIVLDDPTVSARHCVIRGDRLCDEGSRNGTTIEGRRVGPRAAIGYGVGDIVGLGTTRVAVRATLDDRPVAVANAHGSAGGTIPFNRPPREVPRTEAAPLVVPAEAPAPEPVEPLSIAGIVLPVIAGAVVAVLFSPLFAVFAALGPVLSIGTWWERRRRSRRAHRRARRDLDRGLAELEGRLSPARIAEIERRRRLHPDPAEVVRRAEGPSVRLWERRPTDLDAFTVGVGTHDAPFVPPLLTDDQTEPAAAALAMVAAAPPLPDVAVTADLSPGRVIGLVGDRESSLAIARAMVLQLVTHHGPADLALAVGADDPESWSWCRWLPHAADHPGGRRGAGVVGAGDGAAADVLVAAAGERALLAVVDGADPFRGRTTVGRRLLAGDTTAAIVVAPDLQHLPGRCDTVVLCDRLGRIEIVDPRRPERRDTALGWGTGVDVAASAARRLARLDDPELPLALADVPSSAPLLGLLGLSGDDPEEITVRWRTARGALALAVPIGAGNDGPVVVDLVADGPHVLIGGTTGSGKSELLRSLVVALAATADPDHVVMVLVDYKGGAAFDCCADLPHVTGLVTDLDAALAARALRCLEAELRHRELRLREVGAQDLAAFRSATAGRSTVESLPRLVVVVDEFASLAADLPDFLTSLVGIAQRGRSLGVHLVLATQRPAGVVTDDIRANAPCRISLRVTDRHDSVDVIDSPDAAFIPRHRPGRALARFGPDELVAFQSAMAGGRSTRRSVRVSAPTSYRSGPTEPARCPDRPGPTEPGGPTDLRRLVDTIVAAHDRAGGGTARSPWLPPLPHDIMRSDLADPDGWVLVDEPDEQRQSVEGWRPADGHMVVIAGPGAGATTTLATATIDAVRAGGTDAPHVHVIDLDAGHLSALVGLRHVGTVAPPAARDRRIRLLRWLDDEIARRRDGRRGDRDASPAILLVVDDLAGLARAHDPIREPDVHDRLERIWADGPAVGVAVAASVRRAGDLPGSFASTVATVLLHRTGDPADGLRFGITTPCDRFVPGRVVRAGDGAVAQVIRDAAELSAAVAGLRDVRPPFLPPHQVGELGSVIPSTDVGAEVVVGPADARVRIAVRDRDLALHEITLHRAEHALVLGPARSGRTSTLESMARACRAPVVVVGEGDLAERLGIAATVPEETGAAVADRPALVLVDDALELVDATGALADLVAAPPPGCHVVASARPDRLRAAYGHWVTSVRESRTGVLLQPDPLDGDLLGVALPVRLDLPRIPGRGVAVADGRAEVVQIVRSGEGPAPHSEG